MEIEEIDAQPHKKIVARGRDLTTGSVMRHVVLFSLPMLMGSAFHTAYMIINALWVGRGLGYESMAAIAVSFQVFFVLMAVAGGVTLAANILVSQAYGARDWAAVQRVIQNAMLLTALVSFGCVALGEFGAQWLLRCMQTPPEVLPLAAGYLRLFLWTTPFMFGVFFQASVMRGVGDSVSPLFFQAGSLVLTAILDPLLMFGWLGCPRMGLNGTAVATIIAQGCAFVSISLYARARGHIAAPDWRHLRLDPATTLLTLKIGVPSMIQQGLVALGMMVIVSFVNKFGGHATAAYGIATRIDSVAFMPAMAIGMAVSTLAGQNIGANKIERVREVFRSGALFSCSITLAATLLALFIPAHLMRPFSQDPNVVAIGAHYLRVMAVGYLLFSVMFVSNGVINGSGHTVATTIVTFIAFWVVRIPLAAFLSARMERVEAVWYAIFAGLVVGAAISLTYYASGRWKVPVARNKTR